MQHRLNLRIWAMQISELEYHRNWVRNNKEKVLQMQKKYRENNKEKIRLRSVEYRSKNADKTKEYYSKNKEDILANHRNNYLKRKFGITTIIYDNMLKEQNNSCAICKKHTSHFKKRLAVDHNHKTGKIRGLLCYRCNRLYVGIHTLETAIKITEYLKKYDG